jgi:outer membrane protein TolC
MKSLRLSFIIFILFAELNAQEIDKNRDFAELLPPLEALIDSAIEKNSFIEYRDLQIVINDLQLKSAKIDWTRSVGVQASYGYGNFYNNSISSETSSGSTIESSRSEIKYLAAVSLNIPLYSILNRKSDIKRARVEKEQAESMARLQRDELRQLVIKQYNTVILNQRLLKIKTKYFETAALSLQIADKQFLNGVIPVDEYARLNQIFASAEADYETARSEFQTSLLILQEITGLRYFIK